MLKLSKDSINILVYKSGQLPKKIKILKSVFKRCHPLISRPVNFCNRIDRSYSLD